MPAHNQLAGWSYTTEYKTAAPRSSQELRAPSHWYVLPIANTYTFLTKLRFNKKKINTASLSKFKYGQHYSKAAVISKGNSEGANGLFWSGLLCTCHHPYVTSGRTACQREIKTVQLCILQECSKHSFFQEIKWTAKEENVTEATRNGRRCNTQLLPMESQWNWMFQLFSYS